MRICCKIQSVKGEISMTKKYNLCYDVLTILACLMVVFFHCNSVIYNYSDTISWKISVIERCVVYSAIPIFFMLTGAKLMNYRQRYTTKEYAKKRLLRVGVPYLFWNLFYVVYGIVMPNGTKFSGITDFISKFLNSEFQGRYWFFWPLFMVYLVIPVISLVLQAENHRKYLWYLVCLTFGFCWVLNPVMKLLGMQYNSYMIVPVCAGYMMYVLFGYLISTEQWSIRKRIILYALALISGVFAIVYTIHRSGSAGNDMLGILSYEYFPSGLTGAAIFVFLKHLFENSKKLSSLKEDSKAVKLIRNVSGACMGVWLTHSLGILFVEYFFNMGINSYVFRFAYPPVVFLICVVAVLVLKKIPVLKYIV